MPISRRYLLTATPFLLAGCATQQASRVDPALSAWLSNYQSMYGAMDNEPFPVPAVDVSQVNPEFLRRRVRYATREEPGTIVVDLSRRYAYLVQEDGRAMRYGVGVGKEEAFNLNGVAHIQRKAEWPRWTPTANMIRREPERYAQYAGGLGPGPENPLGPRALYLYRNGRDTMYRLHGTTEPWTIGTMVSSGCVRFMNQDIIDLYRRVPVGTKVVISHSPTDAVS